MKPWLKTALYFLAVILVTACVSIALTLTILNTQRGDRVMLDSEEYKTYQALLPLVELMNRIKTEHYGQDISDEELIEGALKGMLGSTGDAYARYYSEADYIAYLQKLDGSYYGIGALIGQPEQIADSTSVPVLKVYQDSPAEKAGLLTGDRVTAVNSVTLDGLTLEEVERLFGEGEENTLLVEIQRGADRLSLTMERAEGVTKRVTHKLFLQRTGYIQIDTFTGTAEEEFAEAIQDLTDRGMRSLVIDLRNNPGGELSQVVSMANRLISDMLLVTVRFANGKEDTYYADQNSVSIPLAVLVNENSASASEIMAAAVQDTGRGSVVGMPTYGKGVVQTTMQLKSNLGWAKMTTAAYFTPNGLSVHGKGVAPDIEIELAADVKALPIDQIDQEDDAQLWAALDLVREQADELETGVQTIADFEDEDDEAA